tara:strand:- start:122 stop:601 length:480 start_codon:yes stop_codon:yes gene_type:complete
MITEPEPYDLTTLTRYKAKKNEIGPSCTATKIEFCCINNIKYVIKTCNRLCYINEKNIYLKLSKEKFIPNLKYYDDEHEMLCISYCGNCIELIPEFNMTTYLNDLIEIVTILRDKYNLYHNDIRPKNICLDSNNQLYLIDFDKTDNIQGENPFLFKNWL